jgi:hypothetical protein
VGTDKRKTINGEDILYAMTALGFDNYQEAGRVYLAKYRNVSLALDLPLPHCIIVLTRWTPRSVLSTSTNTLIVPHITNEQFHLQLKRQIEIPHFKRLPSPTTSSTHRAFSTNLQTKVFRATSMRSSTMTPMGLVMKMTRRMRTEQVLDYQTRAMRAGKESPRKRRPERKQRAVGQREKQGLQGRVRPTKRPRRKERGQQPRRRGRRAVRSESRGFVSVEKVVCARL